MVNEGGEEILDKDETRPVTFEALSGTQPAVRLSVSAHLHVIRQYLRA